MDSKAFGIAGALTLVAGVLGYTVYQSKKSKGPSTPMDRVLLVRMLEELKHQIFTICLTYADAFDAATREMQKKKVPEQTIVDYKQSQIIKIFQNKQKQILQKYGISLEDFQVALSKLYAKDKEIQQYNEEIETMLLNATQGKAPTVIVPEELKKALKPSAALELQRNMQVAMLEMVLTKFYDEVQNNKDFNIDDQDHRAAFVRQKLNMYKLKCQFIVANGPKIPACNYDNFYKLVQVYKRESAQFKEKLTKFDELYTEYSQKIGEKVDFSQIRRRYNQVLQSNPSLLLKGSDLIQQVPREVRAENSAKEEKVDRTENKVQNTYIQIEDLKPKEELQPEANIIQSVETIGYTHPQPAAVQQPKKIIEKPAEVIETKEPEVAQVAGQVKEVQRAPQTAGETHQSEPSQSPQPAAQQKNDTEVTQENKQPQQGVHELPEAAVAQPIASEPASIPPAEQAPEPENQQTQQQQQANKEHQQKKVQEKKKANVEAEAPGTAQQATEQKTEPQAQVPTDQTKPEKVQLQAEIPTGEEKSEQAQPQEKSEDKKDSN